MSPKPRRDIEAGDHEQRNASGHYVGDKPKRPQWRSWEDCSWQLLCCALFDFSAQLMRGFGVCGGAFMWLLRHLCYQVKERVLWVYDSFQRWYTPYKSKYPAKVNVPGFQY